MVARMQLEKEKKLHKLASLRKKSRLDGYRTIGDYCNGAYECNFVSPYSKSAHNVNASVFVMLQDWCSATYLDKPLDTQLQALGYDANLPTNVNLQRLLTKYFGLSLASVFATNLFPFIKPEGMSTGIPQRDLVDAATKFGLLQIEIVKPKLVVCLGLVTFQALQQASGIVPAKTLDEAIGEPFDYSGALVWCQAHTGRMGTNNRNRGGEDRVSKDWAKMKRYYERVMTSAAK